MLWKYTIHSGGNPGRGCCYSWVRSMGQSFGREFWVWHAGVSREWDSWVWDIGVSTGASYGLSSRHESWVLAVGVGRGCEFRVWAVGVGREAVSARNVVHDPLLPLSPHCWGGGWLPCINFLFCTKLLFYTVNFTSFLSAFQSRDFKLWLCPPLSTSDDICFLGRCSSWNSLLSLYFSWNHFSSLSIWRLINLSCYSLTPHTAVGWSCWPSTNGGVPQ